MTDWTNPPTFTNTTVYTATQLDLYLRDNLKHLHETRDWPYGFPVHGDPARWIGRQASGGNAKNLAPSTTYYGRVKGFGTVTHLAVHIVTSTGTMSLAVYANEGEDQDGRPTTRLATTGSVPMPAVGYAQFALSSTVTDVAAGQHWFAVSGGATMGNIVAMSPARQSPMSTGLAAVGFGHPCPDPAPAVAYCDPLVPIIGAR
jgi:hypothetical protein